MIDVNKLDNALMRPLFVHRQAQGLLTRMTAIRAGFIAPDDADGVTTLADVDRMIRGAQTRITNSAREIDKIVRGAVFDRVF